MRRRNAGWLERREGRFASVLLAVLALGWPAGAEAADPGRRLAQSLQHACEEGGLDAETCAMQSGCVVETCRKGLTAEAWGKLVDALEAGDADARRRLSDCQRHCRELMSGGY